MATNLNRDCSRPGEHTPEMYDANLWPALQALLASLADIEFAHDRDVEAVRSSTTDEVLKRTILQKLQKQHEERRTPYVRQIAALQQRSSPMAA